MSSSSLERELRRRVSEVQFSNGSRALYATDASNYRQVPIGVVLPRTVDDVVETIEICRQHGAPILPRGAGTSLAGQCCNAAVVIDMSRHLNQIVDIDPGRRLARVQPGVVLDDLQRAVEPHGLMYGPDPATHAWCTIGGMIGNNSCGAHSLISGLTADVVERLEVATSDGVRMAVGRGEGQNPISSGIDQQLRALSLRHATDIRARYPQIPRRVSGYNLDALLPEQGFNVAKALVGTEGTCVTVLEATVRLIDAPRARALLVLGFRDIFRAADEVMRVLAAKPIALEAVDEVIVGNLKQKAKLPKEIRLLPDGDAWLLVEFAGETTAAAENSARKLASTLSRSGSIVAAHVFTDRRDMTSVWLIRESGLGATAFAPGEPRTWEGWEDAAVAPERLGAYLRDFRRLLQRHRYHGTLYGHFGQGCVHTRTNFDLQTADGIAAYRAFIDEAADLVVSYGGSLSGEHGDGQSRGELLPKMFGDSLVAAFREFKRIWDPSGIMNPGKVVMPYQATEHLRLPGYRPQPTRTYFHLIDEGGIGAAALRCVGVGKCRKTGDGTMCPSYMATRDERHSTRGRAHLLFEMLRGETITDGWSNGEVREALDLCLACKACKAECPVSVDMATYKSEFLAHHYETRSRPLRAHLFGHIDWWAELASRAPRLVNALAGMRPLSAALQAAVGIAPARKPPRFAGTTFQAWMRRHPPRSEDSPVVLWSDTFTNYFHPEVGRAAVRVLERLGYQVIVPPQTCCGRPLFDFGLLESAREHLEAVFAALDDLSTGPVPIIVLEPSCFAVFRDEAVRLCDEPRARALANRAVLFTEFVGRRLESAPLQRRCQRALLHVHCHQRALAGADASLATAQIISSNAELLDAGCCGMAGSFGFDRRHYDVSLAIGERALFPAVRGASPETVIFADGFSCREQIRHATGRRASHVAEIAAICLADDL